MIRMNKKFGLAILASFALALLMSCSGDKPADQANVDDQTVQNSENTAVALEPSGLDAFLEAESSSEKNADNPVIKNTGVADENEDDSSVADASADDEGGAYYDESEYEEPVYKVSLRSDETQGVIEWDTPEGINYSAAQVRISGANGETVTRNFGAGEAIALYSTLPDGVYGWETVITPEISPYVKEQMRAVRESGDLRKEKQLIAQLREDGSLPSLDQARENRQSGNFIVRDGVVRPSLRDDPQQQQREGG